MAIEPVLAELDDARRALLPSGIEVSALLLGTPASAAPDPAEFAKRLGLPFEQLEPQAGGLVAALREGFAAALDADSDVIVSLDADGQHDARQIPDLVRSHLAHRSGLTIGSRWARGGSSPGTGVVRSGLSRLGNTMVKTATGARGVSDSTTSFRVYHPDVARLLLDEGLPAETYGFFSAMVAVTQAHGFSVDEVPIVFRPRYAAAAGPREAEFKEFAANLLPVHRQVRGIRRDMRSNQSLWVQRNPRMRAQTATGESMFGAVDELTTLSDAGNFLSWICDELEPHLGHRVLEVGAGVGAIAVRLADAGHQVTAIEPADNVFPELHRRVAGHAGVTAHPVTSRELLESGRDNDFDSVVYVSVLEHIRDDVDELRTAWQLLRPGGTLALFVPAMPSLYGSLDFKSGHYRRYEKSLLHDVVTTAGFQVEEMKYLDIAGVLPYALMYRVLDVSKLDSGSSAVYDRAIVPVSRFIQKIYRQPARGKNLVAVARRPVGSHQPACPQ